MRLRGSRHHFFIGDVFAVLVIGVRDGGSGGAVDPPIRADI